MAVDIADITAAQLETVRPMLEKLFEQSDQLAAKAKKSTSAQKVSRWLWRMPLKLYQGGSYGKVLGTGGVLPVGTNMRMDYLRAGYFYSAHAVRINQEMIDTSADTSQSVVNVLSDMMAGAMIEVNCADDIAFHQDGTGILTGRATANTANSLTFAYSGDYLGVNRLREGMVVNVWDSTGATKRAGADTSLPVWIVSIDYDARKVTFNQNVTGITSNVNGTGGDLIAFANMDAYGPAALTSFAATYPGTPPITTSGISGDSFRHGYEYFTDTNSANYFYGKLKSTIPQLMPVRVNANSAPFEWQMIHRITAKLDQKRDKDAWRQLEGVAHSTQVASVMDLGMAITTNLTTGGKLPDVPDMLPDKKGYSDVINVGGLPVMKSKRARRDRIVFLNWSKIGRAQLFEARYWAPGGKTIFEGRDATTGQPKLFQETYILQAYDYACFDSGCMGVIDNLPIPEGWDV